MNTSDAHELARGLMDAHGLSEWRIVFNHRLRRTLARCFFGRKQIVLSPRYVELNMPEAVRRTVLHEIAHAAAGWRAGHGPLWQAKCRELGIEPKVFRDDVIRPAPPWVGRCPCGNVFNRYVRPRGRRACVACDGLIEWRGAECSRS